MINYRKIEEAEALLDQKTAAATDPVLVAAGKLKRAILRGWAIWIAENDHQPDVVYQAGPRIIGDLIVELAINSSATHKDGTPLSSGEHAALLSHAVLNRVADGIRWDESGRPNASMTLVEMAMNVKADG